MTLVDLIRRSLSLDRSATLTEPDTALSQAASLEGPEPDQPATIPEESAAVPQEAAGIHSRVFSRVGLLGNPSDGFGGRCISFSLANFSAEVTLVPSDVIRFLANLEGDPESFGNLGILTQHLRGCGYYGGIRILMAMCKRFFEYCQDKEMALDSKNFTLSYTTTIPRQSGLSGSSAIALAALNCLMRYYNVEGSIPVAERPGLVLSAEQELGITAGLQDRVIQVYGGLLLMDFDPGYMAEHGHARLASLDPGLLPPLYIIHPQGQSGKDSGTVHSYVKERWLAGDPSVRAGMAQVAALVEPGWEALLKRDYHQLASLMRLNFRLRRQLYGDAVLGPTNLKMVQVAESVGAAAKLTGSGGAVVVVCPEGPAQEQRLADACTKEGLACVRAEVGPVNVVAA